VASAIQIITTTILLFKNIISEVCNDSDSFMIRIYVLFRFLLLQACYLDLGNLTCLDEYKFSFFLPEQGFS